MSLRRRSPPVVVFGLVGLIIYVAILAACEYLLYRNGHGNPLFKIASADERPYDWVILGASHVMPLDFAEFNARMENETGLRIINLSSPGTGPLYNRFVLEAFLRRHTGANVLYVIDAFAFFSSQWNEERFGDAKLLRTAPASIDTLQLYAKYCWTEGVRWRAMLDLLSGFSKINNRDRFARDVWEGELAWDRDARRSDPAIRDRLAYLYPEQHGAYRLGRNLTRFDGMLELARAHGIHVTVVKPPLPEAFRRAMPDETIFDERIRALVEHRRMRFVDLSATIPEQKLYFDTDHLNRKGAEIFFSQFLKHVLQGDALARS